MNCPKCKEGLIQSLSFRKGFFKHIKVYTIFCGCCEYERSKEIKISKEDYLNSLNVKTLNAHNTKNLLTNKHYTQNYNKNEGLK